MKYLLILISVIAITGCSQENKDKNNADYPVSTVDIRHVVINDNFWLPKIKLIQDTTINYAFKKCDEEGRMKNFLIAGKVEQGKTCGKMPFDDTDLYKIIEGASTSLISQPNLALDAYLDSIIDIISIGQESDGYLTTWFTIDSLNPPAPWVRPSKERWGSEISSHELYNSGHLFEAAATHYLATGKKNFLNIALKNADLLVKNFGYDKLETPPGHQIVETGLIRLYRITKNEQYLKLAKFFLDIRGDSTTHKLYGAYNQDHMPVTRQKEAVGHAVRAVYMYAGMTDIAALYKDSAYLNAVNNLWNNVVTRKMYLTGGIGSRHEGESFGADYELPNKTAYNETCAAIGDVLWNKRMFMLTGESKYYDIIERTLYNGLISGISLDGKKFFYPNPLESDGAYKFNQGHLTRAPWFDCSCCPTNMIRFLPSVPGLIYAKKGDNLFVNLYIANHSEVEINDQPVKISMKTDYPWNGKIQITVDPVRQTRFNLKMRIPGWAQNQVLPGDLYHYNKNLKSDLKLTVNGETVMPVVKDGYLEIPREWNKGDQVELIIPMEVRKVRANSNVTDDLNKVAFECGPIVYCGEEADNPELTSVYVSPEDSLQITNTNLLSNSINELKGNISGKQVTLIPYYIWSNRGAGKMQVWFSVKNSNEKME